MADLGGILVSEPDPRKFEGLVPRLGGSRGAREPPFGPSLIIIHKLLVLL